jgi:hypothetical protein
MPNLVTTSRSFLDWAQSLPNVVIPAGLESDMQEAIEEAEAAEQGVQADLADADLHVNLPPISSTRYRLVRVEPPNR